MQDFQQNLLYRWENEFIDKRGQYLKFDEIKPVVDYVWEQEGLKYPPLVDVLHHNDKAEARGCRNSVWFHPRGTTTKTVLHELAHALTADFEYGTNMHGPDFVGMYMKLLEKYMGYPLPFLMYTAHKIGLKFNILARCPFKD